MKELHAWLEGRLIGTFIENNGEISFRYAEGVSHPISLSLPLSGGWTRRAPEAFLDNLLPDRPSARKRMKEETGAASTDMFDLLNGADATGGVELSFGDERPSLVGATVIPVSEDDIAKGIRALQDDPDRWWSDTEYVRFSLGGNQPKFALAFRSGMWFRSSAALPSTHILKPESVHTPNAEIIEDATMRLAAMVGIVAPRTGIMRVSGEHSYIVERFDRMPDRDGVKRIHTEDMAQSLGIPSSKKYNVSALQILRVLHERADATDELSYRWIKMLAFNTSVANADAHAKNYSLFLRPDGIGLAPIYDAITTAYWHTVNGKELNRRLAMKIAGGEYPAQLTPYHWAKLARKANLDEERVVTIARKTAGKVLAYANEAYTNMPSEVKDSLHHILQWANRSIGPYEIDEQPHASGKIHAPYVTSIDGNSQR